MTMKLTVLVSGATGNQGGAVAQALLASGHKVRALTRNTESPRARQLADQGAELMQGNLDDAKSLRQALQGADTFYLMGSPQEAGVDGETKQGIALANAAKAADVGHLVYGSVANADLDTGIPISTASTKLRSASRHREFLTRLARQCSSWITLSRLGLLTR